MDVRAIRTVDARARVAAVAISYRLLIALVCAAIAGATVAIAQQGIAPQTGGRGAAAARDNRPFNAREIGPDHGRTLIAQFDNPVGRHRHKHTPALIPRAIRKTPISPDFKPRKPVRTREVATNR